MADRLYGTAAGTKHHDCRPSEILKSEKMVQKTCETVESFLNPFEVESKYQLLILASGATASKDVGKYEQAGKDANKAFITTRLKTGQHFFEPVKRLNLKILADMNKKSKVYHNKEQSCTVPTSGKCCFPANPEITEARHTTRPKRTFQLPTE